LATLVQKVRNITASATGVSLNSAIVEHLKAGVRYVLNYLPLSFSHAFASDSSSITSATPIVLDTNKLISVARNSIECLKVPESLGYSIGDTNSIHLATARFPAFYISGKNLYVKPDPTSAASAKAVILDIPAKTALVTTGSSSILGYMDSAVIKYAAHLDANHLAAYWANKATSNITANIQRLSSVLALFTGALPTYTTYAYAFTSTEIANAITAAKDYIGNKTGFDADDFLQDEDAELVRSAVEVASQEINRARTAIDHELAKVKGIDSQVAQQGQKFKLELDKAMSYLEEAKILIDSVQLSLAYNKQAQTYLEMAQRLFVEVMAEVQAYIGDSGNDNPRNNGTGRD
jgi:hypothetical protein